VTRILVGVDGSDAAAAALGWAGRLARAIGADVVVANVFQPGQAEVSPERDRELKGQASDRLEGEWSDPVRASGVAHRTLLLDGSPAALLDAAEDERADLLVVGPRGSGGFARLHIGSVAHHLAQHATCPLAIVPTQGAGHGFGRLVVGVDGSETSAGAVRWCETVARATGAEVVAVYVFEPIAEWVLESDPKSWRAIAERRLDGEWLVPLHDAGITVRSRIVEDVHPVAALTGVVHEEGADMVVVGTRGIGGFLGLRLGRIPVQLVHHTQVPVVLVPPSNANEDLT
jgi:nucleotide-binding universal stress UspA family protein